MPNLRLSFVTALAVTAGALVAGACSSSSDTSSTPADAGLTDSASSDSSNPNVDSGQPGTDSSTTDSGGACNAIANVGTVVSETADPAAVPAMTGGTIADGTYVLTAAVQYAGSSAGTKTHKRTLQITGNTIQLVNSDNGGAEARVTIGIAPNGNELGDHGTCPTGFTVTPNTYTATATTLALRKSGDNQVETYAKQ